MRHGLYIIDFHGHLRGNQHLASFCAEDQVTPFYQGIAPLFERLANITEPVHDGFLRHLALNFRGSLSRSLYAMAGQFGLMEALRLFKNSDVRSLLASMDRCGIDHTVVCSLEPFIMTQDLLEAIRPHRSRISLFASVAREQPDPAGYFGKFIESGEITGLKLHPLVGGYACGELFESTKDIVGLAVEHNLPILIHTGHIPKSAIAGLARGCNELEFIEPLLAAFPRGRFVLAHIGWESWRQVLALAKKYKNTWVETSWQPARIIRRAVDALGPQRVIFGSDFPLFKQRLAYRQVDQALTTKELILVASVNARYLLEGSKAGKNLLQKATSPANVS
jgi:predicted TIM-barrel fold metal-dependent hydrolase